MDYNELDHVQRILFSKKAHFPSDNISYFIQDNSKMFTFECSQISNGASNTISCRNVKDNNEYVIFSTSMYCGKYRTKIISHNMTKYILAKLIRLLEGLLYMKNI